MIEQLKTKEHTFDKVQGKVYITINNTKLQVKEKFSLSSIYNEINLYNSINNGKN